jgi:hypothetical protein
MSLDALPKELLLMTVAYLPLKDIHSLAQCLNKTITLTCLPLIDSFINRRRNINRITAFFGQLRDYDGGTTPNDWLDSPEACKAFGVPEGTEFNHWPEWDDLFEWLQFDGSGTLDWLSPLDENTDQEMDPHKNHEPLSKEQLDSLQNQCIRLNITLPPAFIKLATSQELMDRVASSNAAYFSIGPLRKVPSAIDNGAGGYTMRIYRDQQDCGFSDLYLLPNTEEQYLPPGSESIHCILSTALNSAETEDDYEAGSYEKYTDATRKEIDEGKRNGIEMAAMERRDVRYVGSNFEEWLCMTYFEQWLWFTVSERQEGDMWEVLDELKEYVTHMRVESLGESKENEDGDDEDGDDEDGDDEEEF